MKPTLKYRNNNRKSEWQAAKEEAKVKVVVERTQDREQCQNQPRLAYSSQLAASLAS